MKSKEHLPLILSIAAFLVVGLLVIKPNSEEVAPPYASSSAAPDGVKGLFTLFDESDIQVGAWTKPWTQLPDRGNQTLIVIEPRDIVDEEIEQIEDWVALGNELLVFVDEPNDWEMFSSTDGWDHGDAVQDIVGMSGLETMGLGEVSTDDRLEYREDLERILIDDNGILAGRMEIGEGGISLFLLPDWLRNDTILENDHFELLWPHLKREDGLVWFNDYHRGIQDKPGLLAAYPNWFLAVVLQLVIGALLWIWYKAVRFEPAYTPREWTVRRGDETLLAVGGWYERQKLTREAFEQQMTYVRSLLREQWGLRTDASDPQVLAAARRHWQQEDVERLADLLQSWQEAQKMSSYPATKFLTDSQKADFVIKKLQGE
ncbi:DUF4350 domain-containing protein [Halalkalibacterium halodurans]|jgi:hypothetical protein|uniref:DUF4350 domain-containing protein n=1 Tax=Halalkalibacterium halodurans TaxID=86665 RepID=UPI002AAA4EB3|nr:DUF4350 domain-containing protein [Halalkalibacterium halodurans]MDY7221235.1 DUF4350 domain-containing protein [Halalkalibacterium halodurans]MDY7240474.1 DUF4350 domain-containing protein [Halalkalibacterium halodurans]